MFKQYTNNIDGQRRPKVKQGPVAATDKTEPVFVLPVTVNDDLSKKVVILANRSSVIGQPLFIGSLTALILWAYHHAKKEANLINSTGSIVLNYVGESMSLEMEVPGFFGSRKQLETGSQASLSAFVSGEVQSTESPLVGQGLSQKAAEELELGEGTAVGSGLIDGYTGWMGIVATRHMELSNVLPSLDEPRHHVNVNMSVLSWTYISDLDRKYYLALEVITLQTRHLIDNFNAASILVILPKSYSETVVLGAAMITAESAKYRKEGRTWTPGTFVAPGLRPSSNYSMLNAILFIEMIDIQKRWRQ
ncbi:hypothetical protein BDR04DRAFT_1235244 [Suillus decipiens]|nr:hypothetical protein BDR04DRAFT_1235244 [Suillus decipiens]